MYSRKLQETINEIEVAGVTVVQRAKLISLEKTLSTQGKTNACVRCEAAEFIIYWLIQTEIQTKIQTESWYHAFAKCGHLVDIAKTNIDPTNSTELFFCTAAVGEENE
jgi:hypothetical protein